MKSEKAKKFFSSKPMKSTIVILAVLLVGLAVYLNYRWFYDPIESLGYGDNNMQGSLNDSEETGSDATDGNDYFTATVLSRTQARDEAIDVLKLVTEDEEASAEAKAEAAAQRKKK